MAGLGLMLMSSIQNIIQNWLPTYAVQSGIADKQSGAQMVTIFCVCLTGFQFIFGLLREADSLKLVASKFGQFFSGLVCILLAIFHFNTLSAYISSILYGITLNMIFPTLLSIPQEYGLHFTDGQVSNMMILVTLSLGISSLTGELMKMDLNTYQYSLFGWSVVLFGVVAVVMRILEEEQVKELSNTHVVPLPID
jgi:MFS family permease